MGGSSSFIKAESDPLLHLIDSLRCLAQLPAVSRFSKSRGGGAPRPMSAPGGEEPKKKRKEEEAPVVVSVYTQPGSKVQRAPSLVVVAHDGFLLSQNDLLDRPDGGLIFGVFHPNR